MVVRKLLALVGVLALSAGIALVGVVPAHADDNDGGLGIPPAALPACTTPQATGGWLLRDIQARGTNQVTDFPVRPRNMRLGEPCVSGGEFRIPSLFTEVPIADATTIDPGEGDEELNCPLLDEGNHFDWAPQSAYCLNTPLTYGTGYKPDGAGALAGGTFTLLTEQDFGDAGDVGAGGTHPNTTKYTYSGTNTKPSGSPYAATFISLWTLCKVQGVNQWVNVSASDMPVIVLDALGAYSGTFYMRHTCAGITSSFTLDQTAAPMLVADRRMSSASGSGSDSTYYGEAWTGLHRHGTIAETGQETVNGYVNSYMTLGVNNPQYTDSESYFLCGDGLDSGSTTRLPMGVRYESGDSASDTTEDGSNLSIGVPHDVDGQLVWSRGRQLDYNVSASACAYLYQVHLVVCSWQGASPTAYSCVDNIWTAKVWTRHPDYPTGDPADLLCLGDNAFTDPSCNGVLFPPYVDWGSWDACQGGPEPAWLTFDWVAPLIQHWADCMFVPKGGWDWKGDLSGAWAESSGAELADTMGALADSVAVSETCGVLVSGSGTALGSDFVISTCDWGWAGTFKTLLTWAIYIGFGFWALWFVVQNITGIVNKKTPNPIQEESKGVHFE